MKKLFKGLTIAIKAIRFTIVAALAICVFASFKVSGNKTQAPLEIPMSVSNSSVKSEADYQLNDNSSNDKTTEIEDAYTSTKNKVVSGQMSNTSRANSLPLPEGVTVENGHLVDRTQATISDAISLYYGIN